jgi:hypothetical protein
VPAQNEKEKKGPARSPTYLLAYSRPDDFREIRFVLIWVRTKDKSENKSDEMSYSLNVLT